MSHLDAKDIYNKFQCQWMSNLLVIWDAAGDESRSFNFCKADYNFLIVLLDPVLCKRTWILRA